jgi:AraC-like DNA-binding protein
MAVVGSNVFERLDIGASIWDRGRWRDIHERPSSVDLLGFELEHATELDRRAYNARCLERARAKRITVRAEHAGFVDLFVPVFYEGHADAVLVTGPFTTARPSSTDVLERWRALSGRQGDLADPEFSRYLAATLSTLVLEGADAAAFQELVEHIALLYSSQGPVGETCARVDALSEKLAACRLADRFWHVARQLTDETTSHGWGSPNRTFSLRSLGITKLPEQVIVGVCRGLDRGADPVDETLRRDAFQRTCVQRAHAVGNVLSGRVGGHGVTLLSAGHGSASRTRRFLLDLAEDLARTARRRHRLAVHVGACTRSVALPEQYEIALAAAEEALSEGTAVVARDDAKPFVGELGPLRAEFGRLLEQRPEQLAARFEHYLEAVVRSAGHRLDLARVHLEAGFERLWDGEMLDPKSRGALVASLGRAAVDASTLGELCSAYRRAVEELVGAAVRPNAARRDRSLRRAEELMRRHYAEPLGLPRVAKAVGFAPKYFSRLFHARQGVTFEQYLVRLRIERAKQLLSGTPLTLERIAQLTGLSNRNYLGRVFKRLERETPIAYRRRFRADEKVMRQSYRKIASPRRPSGKVSS